MSERVRIVGLVSCYLEGDLVRRALGSLQAVEPERTYVFEGPAGEPLQADVPASNIPAVDPGDWLIVHHGRWRTDARKRNEMLQRAKRDFPGVPLWGVVLDGDELLHGGEYLRDMIQAVAWEDEHSGASIANADNPPTARMPIRLVERDGSISTMGARVIRLDLIREYNVSSSLVTNVSGVQEGWGNRPETTDTWLKAWEHALDQGKLIAWPPFPCEPVIVHRSHLRHPLRRGLRMSEQELRELQAARERAGRQ